MTGTVKEELARLTKKNGGVLLAEHVVEAAREADNPLHSLFDWNNKTAAHAHRLSVARGIIERYKVEYRPVERKVVRGEVKSVQRSLPRYTPHPSLRSGYAETLDLIAGSERHATLTQELNRWAGHTARFMEYLNAAGLMTQAARIQVAMEGCRATIDSIRESDTAG